MKWRKGLNKEEAKQKLHNLAFAKLDTKPDDLKLADVMQIVNQIDEPQAGRAEEAPRSIWREGYEQGKFEGAWVGEQLKDADEIRRELNKPVIPQFVADWIEESKSRGWDLLASMCFVVSSENKKLTKWFYLGENKNIFARAWLDGYEVEKEKRYTVKVKTVLGQYLGRYYLNDDTLTPRFTRTQSTRDEIPTFTRKELEDAGFGWVFDCEGIGVEEVE